ncbi:related to U1 snRNP protein [Rhynchosporium secalis]|uniref:Related to U1 snRNP protein n=1 Tax=Rhynchosporium secalis TaxID=38038 RepID=A0A1E1M463_RHYSE|nr:related to U1 snRNP protein [Rhynchosporium secalis]
MLKSTHKSTALPLAEGWTEHKAPTGHLYYYNAETKQSTYTRPVAAPTPVAPANPSESFLQHQNIGGQQSAEPPFNNGPQGPFQGSRGDHQGQRGGRGCHQSRPRPQPTDKPKARYPIPGHDPWILVHTKLGRRFVYNTTKDQSFWRIPEKLKDGILALDQQRIKEKAEAWAKAKEPVDSGEAPGAARPEPAKETIAEAEKADDSSEYEEVEVTDDEDEDAENSSKRQRTEKPGPEEPVEFDEDDIAFQLAAMGQEYGLDPGEYGDEHVEGWEEGAEGMAITEEDSAALFKDLLNDSGINPYSPWEKLVEDGKLVDDLRYTALTSMKARKEVWEDWTRERIKTLRDLRAKEEKKDPRMPYLAFLQKHANPKLYWPEFKRKYKKEPEMRDTSMADKDREKFYRDHINRLKLPQSTLKADLLALMKAQPPSMLNNSTLLSHLPAAILADIRYISLDPAIRDPLVEGYISTLPPPPDSNADEETEEMIKEKKDRNRRQKALEDREQRVAEEKRKQKRNLEFGKGRLREEEEEIARAMNVTKKGLQGHLMDVDESAKA